MAKKSGMTTDELKAAIEAQIRHSMGYIGGDLSAERRKAMEYYLGEPFGNEVEGRSAVISRDVMDVIEWMLPYLLKVFATTDEFVRFEPVDYTDVDKAAQETDYCNYIFDKKNSGFLILNQWFKDALLQKNGIVKVYWDKSEVIKKDTYENLNELEFLQLVQDPQLEIIAHTLKTEIQSSEMGEVEVSVHDVTVQRTKTEQGVKIVNVPPEEYGIVWNHNSIDPNGAAFQYHRSKKTVTELLEMGFDAQIIARIPNATPLDTDESVARRNLNDERETAYNPIDKSMREVEVFECYAYVDFDGDGKAELRQIFWAGNEILSNEEVDSQPFCVITPCILPHKFFGLSVADMVMDLQLIKSTIWRQLLDNMFLINNHRTAINSQTVNLDDLLVSRPGGIVRVEGDPGAAIVPMPIQPLNQMSYQMLEYMDKVREGRAGVSQLSQGLDVNALNNNKGDYSIERMMTAAEQRVELIARIFAETGVKALFLRIHELCQKHQDKKAVVQLRNKWVEVNPQEWRERTDMTVNVGLGTGERTKLSAALTALIQMQQTIVAGGGMNVLVTPKNIYNTLADFAKYSGIRNIEPYLTDPDTPEAQQQIQMQQQAAQQPDPTLEALRAQAQLQAQMNQIKQQEVGLKHSQEVARLENDKMRQAAEFQAKLEEMQRKQQEAIDNMAIKLTELELKYNSNVPGALV